MFAVCYSHMGWRLGLQAATGLLLSTFFLGTFYRSASLYHPQRRAILHLKTQRKKVIAAIDNGILWPQLNYDRFVLDRVRAR